MKKILLLLSFLFQSFPTGAASLQTEVLLTMPKAVIESMIAEVRGNFQENLETLEIPGLIPVRLEQLTVNADFHLREANADNDLGLQILGDLSNVILTATALHIDVETEQIVNGVVIRIRVKKNCRNVVVESKDSFATKGIGKITNSPLAINLTELNWAAISAPGDWQFSAEYCEGSLEDDAIESLINTYFEESSELRQALLIRINSKVKNWLQGNQNWSRSFPELNSTFSTRLEEIRATEKNWHLHFMTKVEAHSTCPTFETEPHVFPVKSEDRSEGFEVQIPSQAISLLAKCMHEAGFYKRQDYSNQMPGFRDFMRSWIKKFIYWGDLLRFPAEAEFLFLSGSVDDFSLTVKKSKTKTHRDPSSVPILVKGVVESQMKYLGNTEEPSPYVTFFTALRGGMSINSDYSNPQRPTEFVIRSEGEPEARLTYHWNVPLSRLRDKGINTDAIKDELMKTLAKSEFRFHVDPIVLTSTQQLNIKGISATDAYFKLHLQMNER